MTFLTQGFKAKPWAGISERFQRCEDLLSIRDPRVAKAQPRWKSPTLKRCDGSTHLWQSLTPPAETNIIRDCLPPIVRLTIGVPRS